MSGWEHQVNDLVAGDVVRRDGPRDTEWAVFVGVVSPHPRYPGLVQCVWRLSDGALSFDALDWRQPVGYIEDDERTSAHRVAALRWALEPHPDLLPEHVR